MEKIFFVEDNNLEEVNNVLAQGGRVKKISTVESPSYKDLGYEDGSRRMNVAYAYIVVEMHPHG